LEPKLAGVRLGEHPKILGPLLISATILARDLVHNLGSRRSVAKNNF